MRRLTLVLCGIVSTGIAFAGGLVTEETVFPEGTLPARWHAGASGLTSPTFSNCVSRISLTYSEERAGVLGTLALFATNHASHAESKIVELNTLSSAAQFDFAADTDFRAFRLVTNGVLLSSFAATWMDTRLSTPANVATANNTGSAFDISWDLVEGATGYKVSVWTNMTIGASAGVAVWAETFADMASSKTAALNQERLALADHGSDWRNVPFENGYLLDNGGGIRLGTTTATGWISVPHVVTAGENALRITAARYSQNKGQQLSVLCVLDGGVTNLVGTFPVDFDGTYPAFDMSNAVDVVELPDTTVGGTIVLQTTGGSDGKESRVAIIGIEFISGYAAGTQVRDLFREESVAGDVVSVTVPDLPPVAVQVSVQAIASKEADCSAASAAMVVDLANPPPQPQFAVPGSVVGSADGYLESYDALSAAGSEWLNWITLPYWQAYVGALPVNEIKTASGMGNKSGGFYSYHGTNKNDTASYSLAAVANGSNHMKFGFAVTNDLERFLFGFTISFTARQWTFSKDRKAEQRLHFEYLVTNEFVSITAEGNWVEVEGLRFDATLHDNNSLEAAGVYADYATGSVWRNLAATLQDVVLQPREMLLIRWTPDPVSNGEALGVDDVRLKCSKQPLGTTLTYR